MRSLHLRVLLMLGSSLLLAVLAGGGASWWVLERQFRSYEEQQIRNGLHASALVVEQQLNLLTRFAADWGVWGATYDYLGGARDPDYLAEYNEQALHNMGADAIVLLDSKQRIVLVAAHGALASKPGILQRDQQTSPDLQRVLALITPEWLNGLRAASGHVVFIDERPCLVGASPVQAAGGAHAARGSLLMLRCVSATELQKWHELGQVAFDVRQPGGSTPWQLEFAGSQMHASYRSAAMLDHGYELTLAGERPLRDQSRAVYALLLACLALIWLAALWLAMRGLSHLVLRRVRAFNHCLERLCTSDAQLRLDAGHGDEHGDEIGRLGQTINSLLEQVDAQHRRLQHEASHDVLTGLANRLVLGDRLRQALALLRGKQVLNLALLLIDLDGFKQVNDVYGHQAGDALLRELSQRLLLAVRTSDCAARLGGDEFAVLLLQVGNQAGAMQLAERLREQMAQPVLYQQQELHVSASIGVMYLESALAGQIEPEQLLRQADIAMYQAKQQGRDRVLLFDEAMENMLEIQLRMEQQLREAILGNQIEVWVQPVFDARSAQVTSLELLARWTPHGQPRQLAQQFIQHAEQSGLLRELTLRQLIKAVQTLSPSLQERGDLSLSINVSLGELQDPGFVPDVISVLDTAGLTPARMLLELPAEQLMRHESMLQHALASAQQQGLAVVLDNFGSSYISLQQLRNLPLRGGKVQWLSGWEQADAERMLSLEVATMHALGGWLVCKGVETLDQLQRVRTLGVEGVQGFGLARPMPLDEVPLWLEQQALVHANG